MTLPCCRIGPGDILLISIHLSSSPETPEGHRSGRRLASQVCGELDRGAGGGGRSHGDLPRQQSEALRANSDENGGHDLQGQVGGQPHQSLRGEAHPAQK